MFRIVAPKQMAPCPSRMGGLWISVDAQCQWSLAPLRMVGQYGGCPTYVIILSLMILTHCPPYI